MANKSEKQKDPENEEPKKLLDQYLREALESLRSDDSDKASVKNKIGFNREDGPIADNILEHEEWTDEYVAAAFEVVKHYSKTQVDRNLWKKILNLKNKSEPEKRDKGHNGSEKSDAESLEFLLDENIAVKLTEGKFYLQYLKKDDDGNVYWEDHFMFAAPFTIHALTKQGDKWKIRYDFDNEKRLDPIDTMLSLMTNKLKLDRNSSKFFAQFLYKFKTDRETRNRYEVVHEPVDVENDKITVNRISEQPTEEILLTLIDIHAISTFPDSFLLSLEYALLVPFSYEIRRNGEKFPYRISAGKTHGGKTSDQSLLVLKGFDQPIKDRKESLNTVKTIFTLGQQVELSRLPFLVDDINNAWLEHHAEELKGATDSVKFMARGTKAQTQNTWDMVGMPIFTMNEEPTVPLALSDRIIMSHYTEKHRERQNKQEFERLADLLKPGFMFNLIKETLEGKTITEILQDVHKSVKTDEEINQKLLDYAHSLLTDLCKKYGMEFPDNPKIDTEKNSYDLLEMFAVYVATRLQGNDRDGTTYQKFSVYKARKDGEINEVRITEPGYNDFIREYRLDRFKTMVDFLNEMKNPDILYESKYISTLGKTARCIVLPLDLIRHEDMERIKERNQYFKDNFSDIAENEE